MMLWHVRLGFSRISCAANEPKYKRANSFILQRAEAARQTTTCNDANDDDDDDDYDAAAAVAAGRTVALTVGKIKNSKEKRKSNAWRNGPRVKKKVCLSLSFPLSLCLSPSLSVLFPTCDCVLAMHINYLN